MSRHKFCGIYTGWCFLQLVISRYIAPKIRGYFVLLTVILPLLKSVIGLRKIPLCLGGRENASSIVGVSRTTSFCFLKILGPTLGGSSFFF